MKCRGRLYANRYAEWADLCCQSETTRCERGILQQTETAEPDADTW